MTGYDNKRLDGRKKERTVQYCCTYIRLHRCSSTSTYPRKRYATRRAVRRYIHTYIPYHLQQRNNELMKFIRAKRVNSTVLLYVYTSTPPQQYQYVPKETRRHHLAGRGDAGQDAAAATALLGDYHAQVTGSDFRQRRHRLRAQGGLYGACFRLSQWGQETCGPHGRAHEFRQDRQPWKLVDYEGYAAIRG